MKTMRITSNRANSSVNQEGLVTLLELAIDGLSLCPSLATLLAKEGKALKVNALTWPCHIIEEERSKSWVSLYIVIDKSMGYLYNNLAAQISAFKLQNNDFVRAVSLCLLLRNCQFLVIMSQTIFFNSMVTMHIKPTAPHHTTLLTASVKKKFNYTFFYTCYFC